MTKWKHNMVLQNVLDPLEHGIDPRAEKVKYLKFPQTLYVGIQMERKELTKTCMMI